MKEKVVEGLRRLGLTEYEAKAYAALVGLGEASAREIHQVSGVPRTRIYDILRDLTDKGFVEFVQGSPTYYRVVEPDRVLERLRSDFLEAVDQSAEELKSLSFDVHGSTPVWCVKSDWAIKNRVKDFLNRAGEGEITIACMNPELLKEYCAHLKNHKVTVIVDRRDKLQDSGFDLADFQIQEMREESARWFNDLITEDSYIPEFIMINEGKESVVIGSAGNERMAIIIRLPILTMFQKTFLKTLV
jgi:sugar-specific transcriptional regulator TrmB